MWFEGILDEDFKGIVIEFNGLTSGTVLDKGNGSFEKGHYSEIWIEHTRADCWKKIEQPKQEELVTIEKWLCKINNEHYRMLEGTHNWIQDYYKPNLVKLIESYQVEL